MSLLTKRALRVFSVLEANRGVNDDIIDALLPFFEPFLADLSGALYNPTEFAASVGSTYKWNFTKDIAEELIPRFEKRSWLEEIGTTTESEKAYRVIYTASAADERPAALAAIEQTVSQITAQFQTFIAELSPLTAYNRSHDELSDVLIEWLVSVDAYNEDVLRQKVKLFDVKNAGALGVIESQPEEASRLGEDDRYLCARFVKTLYKENSPWLPDLWRIASIGLLTEVIQDFSKPTSAVKRSDLAVYLDAPVAMEALGLSGDAAAANIRPILAALTQIGCKVRIYRTSVDEIQRVLRAMLSYRPADRTGPTATAIRRREVLERFATSVRDDPDHCLRDRGIHIVERSLTQFPHSHEFFPPELNHELFSRVSWHPDPTPREHDAAVLTFVMRQRGTNQSADVFQTKHVFVTKNAFLSQLARRFCLDQELIRQNQVPPAIHHRQLATMTWLRTGLGTVQEVPKRYLLASCERVLELKRGIIEKARHAVSGLSAEKREQLELLLTVDRSVQVMMDKTLGSSAVIDGGNVADLLEAMRQSLAADIEKKKAKEVAVTRARAKARVDAAEEARAAAEAQRAEVQAQLASVVEEDRLLLESVAGAATHRVRLFRWLLNGSVSLLLVSLAILPLAAELLDPTVRYMVLFVGGVFSIMMWACQIWEKKTALGRLVAWWAERVLARLIAERKLQAKFIARPVIFDGERFTLAPPPTNFSQQLPLE